MSAEANGVEDIYPLSPMQQGLLFHSLYAPESGMYHAQKVCTLRGELHVAAFARAWQQVVDSHAALRTSFVWEGLDRPVQVVQRQVALPWEEHDWRGDARQTERLEELLRADEERGFDLAAAPLMRLTLARTDDDAFYFIWSHHHLLTDGWCVSTILEEVLAAYEAQKQMRRLELPRRRPYRDYIAWLQGQDLSRAEAFWRATLKGFAAPTPLISDPAPRSSSAEGQRPVEQFSLSAETTARLQEVAVRHQLTLNTFVQGAWALLLGRYSGERDVAFGATVSGRPAELDGVEKMIGLFINTLPVRVRLGDREPVVEWLRRLQAEQVEMRQYEYSPLVEVQGWSEVPRGLPLFRSILAFENFHGGGDPAAAPKSSLQISDVRLGIKTNYALSVIAAPGPPLSLSVIYDPGEFTAATIRRLLGHLRTLLEGMAARPRQSVSELEVMTPAERHAALVELNETETAYEQAGLCLHQLFEAQAAARPEAAAVVYRGEPLSYGALDERADLLARRLRRLGVGPETRVGICVERSVEMVVGILGVLKSGGAYVPLDPAYPAERFSFMLEDARVALLLTQEHLRSRIPEGAAPVLALDAEGGEPPAGGDDGGPAGRVTPDNLAYVIYTSGSTGRPKGIALSHRGVVNNLLDLNQRFDVGPADGVLALSSLSFDMCVYEVLGTLAAGGRIVMPEASALRDPAAWAELVERQRVTVWNSAPALLGMLADYAESRPESRLGSLRLALLGGDWVPVALPGRLKALSPGARVIVMGGATEASIHSIIYEVEAADPDWKSIPYGVPMANQRAYVLDAEARPVPVGVPGELHLGGVGLARGYFDRPALTAERFVPDPFGPRPGARMYKTGDRVRLLPDGQIELLGRMDHQVKIRGFRIEPGEVAAALKRHPAVESAVVVARDDDGDKRLVAYAVCAPGQTAPAAAELRGFLKESLPDYMTPSAFVFLEELPLSPNGKIDRRALPAPDRSRPESEGAFAAPATPVEAVVAGIFADVLNLERVGAGDNFFDLGGHSLLATQLASRVRESFELELPLRTLFDSPTVAEIARHIEAAGREAGTDAVGVAELILELSRLSEDQAREMLAGRGGAAAETQAEGHER